MGVAQKTNARENLINLINHIDEQKQLMLYGYVKRFLEELDEDEFTEEEIQQIKASSAEYERGEFEEWQPKKYSK